MTDNEEYDEEAAQVVYLSEYGASVPAWVSLDAGRAPVKLDASSRSKLSDQGLSQVWQLSGLRELTLQGRALQVSGRFKRASARRRELQ